LSTSDTYKTIEIPSDEVLFKEKNSKFFGYAFPISSENEIKSIIEPLRKKHFGAVHFCYAFQIGTETIQYRANDDGEPSNSAGMPIYGQIQSYGLTNVLIVVVRFFGGTKLGVGGLITSYKTCAQMAIEASEIIEKTIDISYIIEFDYQNINKVMRVIKEKNIELITQNLAETCKIEIAVRQKNAERIVGIFNNMFKVKIKIKE
jgi:uncharacterized YigZ family protein